MSNVVARAVGIFLIEGKENVARIPSVAILTLRKQPEDLNFQISAEGHALFRERHG